MSENLKSIQRLDMEKLKSRITKVISNEEALKDVEPMEWPEEVLSGKKKVIITRRKWKCHVKIEYTIIGNIQPDILELVLEFIDTSDFEAEAIIDNL